MFRCHHATTHNSYDSYIWRILDTACARYICCGVCTPVAGKNNNARFKFSHFSTGASALIMVDISSRVKCLIDMAPLGQATAQAPQPLHSASFTEDTLFPSLTITLGA